MPTEKTVIGEQMRKRLKGFKKSFEERFVKMMQISEGEARNFPKPVGRLFLNAEKLLKETSDFFALRVVVIPLGCPAYEEFEMGEVTTRNLGLNDQLPSSDAMSSVPFPDGRRGVMRQRNVDLLIDVFRDGTTELEIWVHRDNFLGNTQSGAVAFDSWLRHGFANALLSSMAIRRDAEQFYAVEYEVRKATEQCFLLKPVPHLNDHVAEFQLAEAPVIFSAKHPCLITKATLPKLDRRFLEDIWSVCNEHPPQNSPVIDFDALLSAE